MSTEMAGSSKEHLVQRSAFLALPPEIRNDICERILVHKRPVKIAKGQSEPHTRRLLDVCRQLKAEFSALYYSANVFVCQCSESDLDRPLNCTTSLATWLQRIGPYHRSTLREIQFRLVTKRDLNKHDLFALLRDQNVRLAIEVGWLPLSVLRVRWEDAYVTQLELSEVILAEEAAEEVQALELTGSSVPKGPDLRGWKRDWWDPVIDRYSKPEKRRLSEFVCPATWRFYARSEMDEDEGKGVELVAGREETEGEVEEVEAGCLSGGLKVLVAKVRRGKGAVARLRIRRGKK